MYIIRRILLERNVIYILLISVLLVACESSRPSYVLDSDEMEDVLYDVHRAHFSYSDYNDRGDGARQYALFLNVLKKHDVTQEEWDSSMVYYTRNAHDLERIYERLFERVNSEASAMGAGVGELVDTTDVWNAERQMLLFDYAPYTTKTWKIEADSILSPGDRVTLRFSGLFLSEKAGRYVTAVLALRLANDSVIVRNTTCSMSGPNTLVASDEGHLGIKSVHGMFMMHKTTPSSNSTLPETAQHQVFSIYDIRLTHEPTATKSLPKPSQDKAELPMQAITTDTLSKPIKEPINIKQHGTKTRLNALPQRVTE